MKTLLTSLCVALAVLLLYVPSGCAENGPSYYVRPSEMALAADTCATSGGLTGLGIAIYGHPVVVEYHALCGDGRTWVWQK